MRGPVLAGLVSGASSTALMTALAPYVPIALSLTATNIAVVLARLIWKDREQRRSKRPQRFMEHAPITAAGMLIATALVWHWDAAFLYSVATGFGVGFSTVKILDLLGDRAIAAVNAAVSTFRAATPPPMPGVGLVDEERADLDALREQLDEPPTL
jgi:hypothetical protein